MPNLLLLCDNMAIELYARIWVGKLESVFELIYYLVGGNHIEVCVVNFQSYLGRLEVARILSTHCGQ